LQKSMDGEKQEMLPIRCLTHDPSVKSSLNWEKRLGQEDKVEKIYMQDLQNTLKHEYHIE
jgi:uncharacterized protein (DUF2132 family)